MIAFWLAVWAAQGVKSSLGNAFGPEARQPHDNDVDLLGAMLFLALLFVALLVGIVVLVLGTPVVLYRKCVDYYNYRTGD